jgi:glycosyltransferase involved in cell wall biosynthesis
VHLVIDGAAFCSGGQGGIRRIYLEALPRMFGLDNDLAVTFATHPTAAALPAHPRISFCRVPDVRRILRPYRVWHRFHGAADSLAWRLRVGGGKGKIWHSTYYSDYNWWQGSRAVMVHDMTYELMPGLFPDAEEVISLKRGIILAADLVLTISATTADDLARVVGVPRSRIRVVPLGCDRASWGGPDSAAVKHIRRRPYLLYVGTRPPYKNFDGLLDAYAKWSHAREIDLVVVGAPWSQRELALLTDAGLTDRVSLLSSVGDADLGDLYRGAAAFVYPSFYEGFGLPLLEAMACGCAIVASRIPSTLEVAERYPVYFDPANTDSLLVALDEVLDTSKTAEKKVAASRILERYTWDNTAREMLQAFRQVAG